MTTGVAMMTKRVSVYSAEAGTGLATAERRKQFHSAGNFFNDLRDCSLSLESAANQPSLSYGGEAWAM
jgi:hypothetical protein